MINCYNEKCSLKYFDRRYNHNCSCWEVMIYEKCEFTQAPPPVSSSSLETGYITDRISQKHLDTIVCLSRTIVRRNESGGDIKAPIKTMTDILREYDK
jgi:hypothetical protein